MPYPAPFVSRVMDDRERLDRLQRPSQHGLLQRAVRPLLGRGLRGAWASARTMPKARKLTIYTAEVHVCYVQRTASRPQGHGHLPAARPRREAAARLSGNPPRRRLARRHLRIAVAACRHGRAEGRALPGRHPARRSRRCAPPMPSCRCRSAPAARSASLVSREWICQKGHRRDCEKDDRRMPLRNRQIRSLGRLRRLLPVPLLALSQKHRFGACRQHVFIDGVSRLAHGT